MKYIIPHLIILAISSNVFSQELQYDAIFSPDWNMRSQELDSSKPLIFYDPECLACKQLTSYLMTIPSEDYELIIVQSTMPTEKSLKKKAWHLSSGGGLPSSKYGCQKHCSTLLTINNEDLFNAIYVKGNILTDREGNELLDALEKTIHFTADGLVNSEGEASMIGGALIGEDSHIETPQFDQKLTIDGETDRLMSESGEPLMMYKIALNPVDEVRRFARLAINTRAFKTLGGDIAATPAIFFENKFSVLHSSDELKQIIYGKGIQQ